MPGRERHYHIQIDGAKKVAQDIGDVVAKRLRDKDSNKRIGRAAAISAGIGVAAFLGGREAVRRFKRRGDAGQEAAVEAPRTQDPIHNSDQDNKDEGIYGVEVPLVPADVMAWIKDKDNVRRDSNDVPSYIVAYISDVNGADVNNVESAFGSADKKTGEIFGNYFDEVNRRVIDDAKRRGFEVDENFVSPLGLFENYSPSHARQSFIRELGYREDQTPDEFAANIKSEIDCLALSYIRQSALPALEKFRSARGMSSFADIAVMQPVDLSRKDLVKLNLVSAEEAEAYKNDKQDVPEEEPTIGEYAKRVKDLIEASEKLEGEQGPVKSFGELRDFEDKILVARIDASDCLSEVYTSLRAGGEFVSDVLIRRESERRDNPPAPVPTPTHPHEDDPRRQGNRCSTTKKIALAFAAGAALVGGAWISHELTEDNGGDTTSLSYNIDLSHNSINAFPGSQVDHVVQGNNYLGNNSVDKTTGGTNGAKQSTGEAPSNGSGQDGMSKGNGAEDGGQRSGSLTPQEARDYLDGLDGNKDGKLKVVISKADGSDGIDTVDWALARDAKTGLFDSSNPSINGVERWGITSAAIADQGKTAKDYHWVNNGDVFEFKVGDQMVRAFIKADVPLVKAAQAPQAPSQSATPDNGSTQGTQTPETSKTPTATATGTETQTPTLVPTRTPAVNVVTNTPTPSVAATATSTSVNQEYGYSSYSLMEKSHDLVTSAVGITSSPAASAIPSELPSVMLTSGIKLPPSRFTSRNKVPAWLAFAAAEKGATDTAGIYKGMKRFGLSPFMNDDDDDVNNLVRRIVGDKEEKKKKESGDK